MKICKKCGIEKELNLFGVNNAKKDGLDIYCKECNNKRQIESSKNEEIKNYKSNYGKRYREINKKSLEEKSKENYRKKKDKIKERVKIYGILNKDKIREKKQKYRKENPNREYMEKYREDNKDKLREYFKNYVREKRNNDINYRLKDQLRHRIKEGLKFRGFKKEKRTEEILGCRIEDFIKYIENKFEIWMNWENYGKYNGDLRFGWDIDHIIPLSLANNKEEMIKLCHHTNLQPLCSYTNRYIKKDLINY